MILFYCFFFKNRLLKIIKIAKPIIFHIIICVVNSFLKLVKIAKTIIRFLFSLLLYSWDNLLNRVVKSSSKYNILLIILYLILVIYLWDFFWSSLKIFKVSKVSEPFIVLSSNFLFLYFFRWGKCFCDWNYFLGVFLLNCNWWFVNFIPILKFISWNFLGLFCLNWDVVEKICRLLESWLRLIFSLILWRLRWRK